MPSLTSLDATAQERKARLAKLKNLKRKQPEPADENDNDNDDNNNNTISDADADKPASKYPKSPSTAATEEATSNRRTNDNNDDVSKGDDHDHSVTSTYLSGRNYDPETRGPRLGFEIEPAANQPTLEADATALAAETQKQAQQDAKPDKPLDLFTLRPKKPNWDLKRDLDAKLQVLNVRTENAIAKLVRERIEEAKKASAAAQKNNNNINKNKKGSRDGDEDPGEDMNGEAIGMDGVALVEAMHMREREEEEDEKREKADQDMDDGS